MLFLYLLVQNENQTFKVHDTKTKVENLIVLVNVVNIAIPLHSSITVTLLYIILVKVDPSRATKPK